MVDESLQVRRTRRLSAACAALAAALGVAALIGWGLGAPRLASLSPGLVPMAPDTAVLFVLVGAAIALRVVLRGRAVQYVLPAVVGGLSALTGLLILLSSALGARLAAERLGLPISGSIGAVPLGYMSPVTAAFFLVAGVSLSASVLPPRGAARAVARASAAAVIVAACALLLAYAIGSPFLYGGPFIPPAATTSLALLALGAALYASLSRPAPSAAAVLSRLPALVFAVMAAGTIAAGYWYVRVSEDRHRGLTEDQLSAVAALKIDDIVHWRRERLGDGAVFHENAVFAALVRSATGIPPQADAVDRLGVWLREVQSAYGYERVYLLDSRGARLLSVPEAGGAVPPEVARRADESLRIDQVLFQDFYRDESDGRVHLAVLAPIRDAGSPIGVLVLQTDPRDHLYPLITRWPTSSRSAETLLVRRDGTDALFLNPLRFDPAAALNRRIPLATGRTPAVQAVLGRAGIVEDVDYRGVPVVADVRPVPGSLWFLVARVDLAEVRAGVTDTVWILALLETALIGGTGMGMGLIWRRQRADWFRWQLEALRAQQRADERFAMAFQSRAAMMAIATPDGRYLEVNDQHADFVGRPRERVIGRTGADLGLSPVDPGADTGEARSYEVVVRREDGTMRYGLLSWQTLVADGEPRVLQVITDITERKRSEERILHLNRVLRAIRDISQLIMREKDPRRLIDEACRLLVQPLGYSSVLIILVDRSGAPNAWAQAGIGAPFSRLEEELRAGKLPACSRAAQARQGVTRVSDPATFCAGCAISATFDSGYTLYTRIAHAGVTYGCLTASVDAAGSEDEESLHVDEVANDLALALHAIEQAGATSEAVRAREQAEAELLQAQKMEAIGRLAGGVAHDFNNMLAVILGYAEAALLRLRPPDPLHRYVEEIRKAARRSADLTQQLLTFSRKQIIVPRALDLNAAVEEQRQMLGRLIGEDIEVKLSCADALWSIHVDPTQLAQVLANLVVNARDAIADVGAVTIETSNVTVDAHYGDVHPDASPGEYVLLAVSDTGSGMDLATRERLFEPFFTTKETGTGLGLSTVYGIVKQNGGFIHVYSEPGLGSTFRVYFPRFAGEAEAAAAKPARQGLSGDETLLVVEDEQQILDLIRAMLEARGYRVLTAASPGEALLLAEQHPGDIDLVVTDVVMPAMNGRELTTRLERLMPGIRTLFMSGYTADAIAHRGVLDEGIDFLSKPFDADDLAAKVREILDRR